MGNFKCYSVIGLFVKSLFLFTTLFLSVFSVADELEKESLGNLSKHSSTETVNSIILNGKNSGVSIEGNRIVIVNGGGSIEHKTNGGGKSKPDVSTTIVLTGNEYSSPIVFGLTSQPLSISQANTQNSKIDEIFKSHDLSSVLDTQIENTIAIFGSKAGESKKSLDRCFSRELETKSGGVVYIKQCGDFKITIDGNEVSKVK
jgi:hypothetical protein